MGVLEFRTELQQLKESFEQGLIPKDVYESMCMDCQRRNLSASVGSPSPLSALALQRLLYPVCVTVTFVLAVIVIIIVILYEWLEYDKAQSGLIIQFHGVQNASISNISAMSKLQPVKTHEKSAKIGSEGSLFYLSTNDGLLSHFFQLEHLWSIAHSLNRTLIPIPFHSGNHYPDVEWVSLCDIFEFPADVVCSKKEPQSVTKSKDCTLLGIYDWAIDPKMYSLPETQKAVHSCDFRQIECIAGYVDTKSGFYRPKGALSTFPMAKFTEKYVRRAEKARERLGLHSWENMTVAHWIGYEFDPDRECATTKKSDEEKEGSSHSKASSSSGVNSKSNSNESSKKDSHSKRRRLKAESSTSTSSTSSSSSQSSTGSNKAAMKGSETLVDAGVDLACLSYMDFIKYVKANVPKKNNLVTYIATDEKNGTILAAFAKAGFKTYVDMKMHDSTTLENYVVDLVMMAASTHQIFFGSSKYKQLFERIYSQSYKQFATPSVSGSPSSSGMSTSHTGNKT
jgi:hypothetical protein